MKTLYLSSDVQAEIRKDCAQKYPHEACGLLLGREGRVTRIVPSPNMSENPKKNFDIDPALIIHHQKAAREEGDTIIGHYHSHPDGQAKPSVHDQAQNYDHDLIWLIVQVTDGQTETMKAFATDPKSGQLTPVLLKPAETV